MMGWVGTVELAAHGIAMEAASLAFMVHVGLSSAATIRVAQFAGRGDAADCARGQGGGGAVGRRWRRW
jgi:MATE family multidrug resistance protein